VKSQKPGKHIALGVGAALLIFLFVGCGLGAVGSAIRGASPLVPEPEIHLPPQPVFPAAKRDQHLGLGKSQAADGHAAEEPAKAEAPKAADDHGAAKTVQNGAAQVAEDHGAEGEKPHASPLGVGEFAVTNTMLAAWLGSAVIILVFALGARKASLVPGRLQSLVESLIELVLNFATGVAGAAMARKALPIVGTIFFFILFNALLALFPFYQFMGFKVAGGDEIQVHLFRSPATDVNMPLALAIVSFVFVEFWGLRANGIGYLKKFFAFGKLLRGKPAGLIDVFVGLLELFSEFARVISLTFRLFGNLTAGEIVVVMVTYLAPFVAIEIFFGLELLVAFIQAAIFAALTVVFLSLAVTKHESHEEHH